MEGGFEFLGTSVETTRRKDWGENWGLIVLLTSVANEKRQVEFNSLGWLAEPSKAEI